MTQDFNTKKTPVTGILALVAAVLIALGSGWYVYSLTQKTTPAPAEIAAPDVPTAPTPEAALAPQDAPQQDAGVVVETKKLDIPGAAPSNIAAAYDPAIAPMMAPHSLGNPEAPIQIVEYSSLTCGHCAQFHTQSFANFKTQFIDTGKVYFTFKEFPLNEPAVDATMILRCMPRDKYMNFMSLLFTEQDKWAYDAAYKDKLRQYAKLAGMSDADFDACLANTALKSAIVGDMQAAQQKYQIGATPTFVVNDGKRLIVGDQPLSEFEKIITEVLTPTPAPASAPAAPASPEVPAPAPVAPAQPETPSGP